MKSRISGLLSNVDVVLHDLDSADIERATGLTAELQRIWRNRGVIAKKSGTRAKYTPLDAAAFGLAKVLRFYGCPQPEALKLSRDYEDRILQLAMENAFGVIETFGTPSFTDQLFKEMDASDRIFGEIAGIGESSKALLLVSADGQGFEEAREVPEPLTLGGPIHFCTIDLVALSRNLADQIGRPLVTIRQKIADDSGAAIIRRIYQPKTEK